MDRAELGDLARRSGFPRVTLTFPTFGPPDAQQDPIRLGNALRRAEALLSARGVDRPAVDRLLAEARDRVRDSAYWNRVRGGLAVLVEPDETRFVELSRPVAEDVFVGERYQLRPLFSEASDDHHLVLSVARGGARLFRAHQHLLEEVPLDGPESLDEVRAQVEYQPDVTSAPRYQALGQAPEDYHDVLLDQFLLGVAKAVDQATATEDAVLVLAGGPREVGWLREKLAHGRICEATVDKNPASLDDDELGRRAWDVAAPQVRADRAAALDRLHRAVAAAAPGSSDTEEVVRGARSGRVEVLFHDPTVHLWGRYDDAQDRVERRSGPDPDAEDLVNCAAVWAFATGARVLEVPEAERRSVGPMAAVFRW